MGKITKLVNNKISNDIIIGVAKTACLLDPIGLVKMFHEEDECDGYVNCKKICQGMVTIFTPKLTQVITIGKHSPKEICLSMKVCEGNKIPPRYIPPQPYIYSNITDEICLNTKLIKIGIITDIHLDLNYTINYSKNCGLPLCCNNFTSKLALTNSDKANYYTTPDGKCDSSLPLLHSAVKFLSEQNLTYLLWLGDASPHNVYAQSDEENLNDIKTIAKIFKKYLNNTIILPIIGNHDMCPVNEFEGKRNLLIESVKPFRNYLTPDAINSFIFGGFYQIQLEKNLYLVALNTNYYVNENIYQTIAYKSDWLAQLSWLNNTIFKIVNLNNDNKIIILQHHPQIHDFNEYINYYNNVIKQYEDKIIIICSGHSHTQGIRVFNNKILQINFGSVTSYTETLPSISIITLNKTNLKEINSYWDNNITNLTKNDKINWKKYSYTDLFNMNNLSITEFNKFIKNKENNKTLSNIYNNWVTQGYK
jgi:predicted phosphodiesterase